MDSWKIGQREGTNLKIRTEKGKEWEIPEKVILIILYTVMGIVLATAIYVAISNLHDITTIFQESIVPGIVIL